MTMRGWVFMLPPETFHHGRYKAAGQGARPREDAALAHPGLRKRFNRTALCGGTFQNPTNVLLFSYVQKLMAQAPCGWPGDGKAWRCIVPKSRDLKNAGQAQSVAGRQCTIPRHFSLPSPQPRLLCL
jgi:hypothetical protein